jgi:hypothetical protein
MRLKTVKQNPAWACQQAVGEVLDPQPTVTVADSCGGLVVDALYFVRNDESAFLRVYVLK